MKRRTGGRAVRQLGTLAWGWVLVAVCLLTARPPDRLSAQDTTRVAPVVGARVVAIDTTHRVSPGGAFRRSLLLPGWGQAATGRHTSGALFVAWEGVTMMMTLKAQREADYFKRIGATGLKHKRQEVQDWLVLWIFNHLFSGAEAYVAAHLQDFPKELKLQSVPGGIGVSVPLP
jgi:hypothetical protein